MTQEALEEISCRQFVELVTDYLEHQLDESRRTWTEEHLAECDPCRAYLDQMRMTITTLRDLTHAELDSERREAILQAFRAKHAH